MRIGPRSNLGQLLELHPDLESLLNWYQVQPDDVDEGHDLRASCNRHGIDQEGLLVALETILDEEDDDDDLDDELDEDIEDEEGDGDAWTSSEAGWHDLEGEADGDEFEDDEFEEDEFEGDEFEDDELDGPEHEDALRATSRPVGVPVRSCRNQGARR